MTEPIKWVRRFVTAVAVVTAGVPGSHATDRDLTGRVRVVDGDTLDLDYGGVRTRIRLNAIDAPEAKQTCRDEAGQPFACGAEAAAALRRIVEGQQLRCVPRYLDRYGRTVATCFFGTIDVGGRMVQLGEAVAFRKYGLDYLADEEQARAARRGLWRGEFTMPSDWRAGAR
jgi:endonuclease YncB( thermonuclease family)